MLNIWMQSFTNEKVLDFLILQNKIPSFKVFFQWYQVKVKKTLISIWLEKCWVFFLFYLKAKNIDLSDLLEDPIVYYQRKFYVPLVVIIWFFIPTFIPYYYWNESFINSSSANVLRYVFMLHCAFMVNSVAHLHSAGYSESK